MSDVCWCFCLFFKQKTAYEMRISDWSSDVCSSDLLDGKPAVVRVKPGQQRILLHLAADLDKAGDDLAADAEGQIGLVAGAHLAGIAGTVLEDLRLGAGDAPRPDRFRRRRCLVAGGECAGPQPRRRAGYRMGGVSGRGGAVRVGT